MLVWHAPLTTGGYDVVIDANQNGVYDASTDGLDSGSPGFVVIWRTAGIGSGAQPRQESSR